MANFSNTNTQYNPATGTLWASARDTSSANLYFNILDRSNDFNFFTQLYLARFKWSGSSLDLYQPNNYIERQLFNYGMVALYKHEYYGNIIVPAYAQGINPFGEPSEYLCQSYGGFIKEVKSAKDIVVMRDNLHEDIPLKFVERYSQKTGDTQRTEEVYVRGLKSPNILTVTANSKETAKLVEDQILENKQTIVLRASKNGEEPVKPVALQTGRNASELLNIVNYRRSKFNELLNYFGIKGDPELKAAQMNNAEIDNNETIAKIQLYQFYQERKRAVDEATKRFGFDLKVEISEPMKPENDEKVVKNGSQNGQGKTSD